MTGRLRGQRQVASYLDNMMLGILPSVSSKTARRRFIRDLARWLRGTLNWDLAILALVSTSMLAHRIMQCGTDGTKCMTRIQELCKWCTEYMNDRFRPFLKEKGWEELIQLNKNVHNYFGSRAHGSAMDLPTVPPSIDSTESGSTEDKAKDGKETDEKDKDDKDDATKKDTDGKDDKNNGEKKNGDTKKQSSKMEKEKSPITSSPVKHKGKHSKSALATHLVPPTDKKAKPNLSKEDETRERSNTDMIVRHYLQRGIAVRMEQGGAIETTVQELIDQIKAPMPVLEYLDFISNYGDSVRKHFEQCPYKVVDEMLLTLVINSMNEAPEDREQTYNSVMESWILYDGSTSLDRLVSVLVLTESFLCSYWDMYHLTVGTDEMVSNIANIVGWCTNFVQGQFFELVHENEGWDGVLRMVGFAPLTDMPNAADNLNILQLDIGNAELETPTQPEDKFVTLMDDLYAPLSGSTGIVADEAGPSGSTASGSADKDDKKEETEEERKKKRKLEKQKYDPNKPSMAYEDEEDKEDEEKRQAAKCQRLSETSDHATHYIRRNVIEQIQAAVGMNSDAESRIRGSLNSINDQSNLRTWVIGYVERVSTYYENYGAPSAYDQSWLDDLHNSIRPAIARENATQTFARQMRLRMIPDESRHPDRMMAAIHFSSQLATHTWNIWRGESGESATLDRVIDIVRWCVQFICEEFSEEIETLGGWEGIMKKEDALHLLSEMPHLTRKAQ